MVPVEERLKRAQVVQGEELWTILRDSNPDVLFNAILNRHLSEEMAVFMAKRKNVPAEALGALAGDARFKDSYPLKLAICRHPKTSPKITLSLLKFIRIFDLGDMTRDQNIPISIRQKIEYGLTEKIPSLPSGVKTALSKRSSSSIVMALIERGDARVIGACLDNPSLTEGHLIKIITKTGIKPLIIRMIAEHPKWSLRYSIRFSLVRNFHTPLAYATRFIEGMKTQDLRELYADSNLPLSSRPFIFRELRDRGETTDLPEDETFPLSEEDENGTT